MKRKTIWLDKNQICPYRIGLWNGFINGLLYGAIDKLINDIENVVKTL